MGSLIIFSINAKFNGNSMQKAWACPSDQALRRYAPPSPAVQVLALAGDDPSRKKMLGRRFAPSFLKAIPGSRGVAGAPF
jgi:hypothetical protein